jgi:hypothetical protein
MIDPTLWPQHLQNFTWGLFDLEDEQLQSQSRYQNSETNRRTSPTARPRIECRVETRRVIGPRSGYSCLLG